GIATFTYTGTNTGNDTVTASYTGQNSNSTNVSWLVPVKPVSTTTVIGQFFPSDLGQIPGGPFYFDTPPSATPLWTQVFPSIAFNPPSGAIPGNTTVNQNTHPFTDVVMDANGNFAGTIPAQGNGYQAAVGSLNGFQVVFTGSFIVTHAGNTIVSVYVDN